MAQGVMLMNGALALAIAAIPAFVGSTVEFIEALTVVLAVGTTRSWRAAVWGALAAVVALALIVAVFVALAMMLSSFFDPESMQRIQSALKVAVGALLLLFGLKWLRKSILRFAGIIAIHDEELIYQREVAELRAQGLKKEGLDKVGFFVAFQATLVEGLEVVFIVLAFGGAGASAMQAAIVGALAAGIVVISAGVALKAPLTRVPENAMKFAVGSLLSTFGVFWAGEGLGVSWPGDALSVLVLFAIMCLVSWICLKMLNALLPQGARVEARNV